MTRVPFVPRGAPLWPLLVPAAYLLHPAEEARGGLGLVRWGAEHLSPEFTPARFAAINAVAWPAMLAATIVAIRRPRLPTPCTPATSMNVADLRHLFAYGHWASARLLAAGEALPEADWSRDLGSSFPSVRDTLAHLIGAEWVWLRRWEGHSPDAPPGWTRAASPATLRDALGEVAEDRERFLAGLRDADLARTVRFRFLSGGEDSGALGDLMLHVANHSTHHRGQVVTLLRQLGAAPPSTDLFVFDRERRPSA